MSAHIPTIAMQEIARRLENYDEMVAAHDSMVSALEHARAWIIEARKFTGPKLPSENTLARINAALN